MTGSNFLSKIFRINLWHSFEMLINKSSRLSLKDWQTARILKFCVGTYVKLWVFHRKIVTKNLAKLNPFHVTCLFLYSLKTSENCSFFDVFRRYRKRSVKCEIYWCFQGDQKGTSGNKTLKQIFHDLLVCCLF